MFILKAILFILIVYNSVINSEDVDDLLSCKIAAIDSKCHLQYYQRFVKNFMNHLNSQVLISFLNATLFFLIQLKQIGFERKFIKCQFKYILN